MSHQPLKTELQALIASLPIPDDDRATFLALIRSKSQVFDHLDQISSLTSGQDYILKYRKLLLEIFDSAHPQMTPHLKMMLNAIDAGIERANMAMQSVKKEELQRYVANRFAEEALGDFLVQAQEVLDESGEGSLKEMKNRCEGFKEDADDMMVTILSRLA